MLKNYLGLIVLTSITFSIYGMQSQKKSSNVLPGIRYRVFYSEDTLSEMCQNETLRKMVNDLDLAGVKSALAMKPEITIHGIKMALNTLDYIKSDNEEIMSRWDTGIVVERDSEGEWQISPKYDSFKFKPTPDYIEIEKLLIEALARKEFIR